MKNKKTVYLPVGQRGSGKSTYCNKILENQPEVYLISRDNLIIKHYGSADVCSYTCNYPYLARVIYRFLRLKLSNNKTEKILFDYYTEDNDGRKEIIEVLKTFGASRVVALYFVTPLELVNEWFWKKSGIAKVSEMKNRSGEGLTFYSDSAPENDYRVFHDLASGIESIGFDQVIKIDPRNEPISI